MINLLPFVVEAFGYNKKIYKDIDRLYQSRKYEFYKAAKEHELYTHQIVMEGGLLQEEYCKKALGILLCLKDDMELSEAVSDIIRKGWTYAYLFVQNHSEIDLEKFLKNAIRKAGGINNVSDDWLNTQLFIVYFLALNANKKITENSLLKQFEETLLLRWQHYRDDDPTRISIDKASDGDKIEINCIRNKIFEKHGRIKNYDDIYGGNPFAELLAFIFDYERLSASSVLGEITLTKREIDELVYLQIIDKKSDDSMRHLTYTMHIRLLIKAYKEVKQRYFENNRETMYVELEGLEKELAAANQEITRLTGALSEAREKLTALEKENTRLKDALETEKHNRQELTSLREFLFRLDQQEKYVPEDEDIDPEKLKDLKAVLIGGHEKWQTKMKELLPRFIFIHPDNQSFDLRLLENVPVVFVYTNYLNHAVYYRTMNAIAGKDVKVVYLKQQNEKKVLQLVYKTLK